MKVGLGYRGRLRGELAAAGQELDLTHQALTAWRETQHTIDGAHTDITCDTFENAGLTNFGGRWLMPQSAVLTPPYTITANQNDYDPRNIEKAIWVRLSTDASRDITGIVTDKDEFRHLILTNVGNFNIVLKHNSTSSKAIWRIGNPMSVDVTVGAGASVWMLYDAHAGNWRVINAAGDVSGVFTSSGGTAPDDAQYVVGAANADLTNEKVATSTTSITVTIGASTATWERAALTGDITASANSNATTIANDAVSNAKLANMAAWTIKMRNNAASGDPQDQTLADITEDTTPVTGDFALGWDSSGQIRKYNWGNVNAAGYWSPLTNGDPYAPELIMSDGDTIAVWTAL